MRNPSISLGTSAECGMGNLKERTKSFALNIIKMAEKMPRNTTSYILAKQIIRSATSTGANYRAACRARSRADFISKMGIVEEETDETLYWLEIIVASGQAGSDQVEYLVKEGNEILAMVVSSIKTARNRRY